MDRGVHGGRTLVRSVTRSWSSPSDRPGHGGAGVAGDGDGQMATRYGGGNPPNPALRVPGSQICECRRWHLCHGSGGCVARQCASEGCRPCRHSTGTCQYRRRVAPDAPSAQAARTPQATSARAGARGESRTTGAERARGHPAPTLGARTLTPGCRRTITLTSDRTLACHSISRYDTLQKDRISTPSRPQSCSPPTEPPLARTREQPRRTSPDRPAQPCISCMSGHRQPRWVTQSMWTRGSPPLSSTLNPR